MRYQRTTDPQGYVHLYPVPLADRKMRFLAFLIGIPAGIAVAAGILAGAGAVMMGLVGLFGGVW